MFLSRDECLDAEPVILDGAVVPCREDPNAFLPNSLTRLEGPDSSVPAFGLLLVFRFEIIGSERERKTGEGCAALSTFMPDDRFLAVLLTSLLIDMSVVAVSFLDGLRGSCR